MKPKIETEKNLQKMPEKVNGFLKATYLVWHSKNDLRLSYGEQITSYFPNEHSKKPLIEKEPLKFDENGKHPCLGLFKRKERENKSNPQNCTRITYIKPNEPKLPLSDSKKPRIHSVLSFEPQISLEWLKSQGYIIVSVENREIDFNPQKKEKEVLKIKKQVGTGRKRRFITEIVSKTEYERITKLLIKNGHVLRHARTGELIIGVSMLEKKEPPRYTKKDTNLRRFPREPHHRQVNRQLENGAWILDKKTGNLSWRGINKKDIFPVYRKTNQWATVWRTKHARKS